MLQNLIIPPFLRSGSRIAIVSPAGIARTDNVEKAIAVIESRGIKAVIMPHAMGRYGSYSAPKADRLADISEALTNPDFDAVLCTRGGYGTVQLLDGLDRLPLRDHAKWLIGFSDISALHALLGHHGIASIHGPMAKHISRDNGHNPDFEALLNILYGHNPDYKFDPHPYNRQGSATAPLAGGNMAVLGGLMATPFNSFRPHSILFIEDLCEPIYKIERQLYQLKLAGILPHLSGLLVGQFTDYRPDANHETMEAMIRDMVDGYDFPVAFNIPAGHGTRALPLVLAAENTLTVSETGVSLTAEIYSHDMSI